jgi:hypothetical protein
VKVAKPGEVTNEEMAELRFENLFVGEINNEPVKG